MNLLDSNSSTFTNSLILLASSCFSPFISSSSPSQDWVHLLFFLKSIHFSLHHHSPSLIWLLDCFIARQCYSLHLKNPSVHNAYSSFRSLCEFHAVREVFPDTTNEMMLPQLFSRMSFASYSQQWSQFIIGCLFMCLLPISILLNSRFLRTEIRPHLFTIVCSLVCSLP